ncbi:MAG: hypothetical protein JSR72_20010 [Proteobacteria bacterium]|nr:hypothetical protein [Pseudomonadota bacterium]
MRVLLRLAVAASLAGASLTAVHAGEWCGFKDKSGSQVRCGYSHLSDCKQAEHDKAALCVPDPSFAQRLSARGPKVAAAKF